MRAASCCCSGRVKPSTPRCSRSADPDQLRLTTDRPRSRSRRTPPAPSRRRTAGPASCRRRPGPCSDRSRRTCSGSRPRRGFPAGRPVGAVSSLIMKLRPQLFGRPGKNSASSERAGFWVSSMVTRMSLMFFCDISATVSGFRTCWPFSATLVQDHPDEPLVVPGASSRGRRHRARAGGPAGSPSRSAAACRPSRAGASWRGARSMSGVIR